MTVKKFETTSSYKIGKTTILIERIFRKENAEALYDIILKWLHTDIENIILTGEKNS